MTRTLLACLLVASAACQGDGNTRSGGVRDVEFGLDERPTNATCKPWGRPQDSSVTLTAALPNQTFTQPLHALRQRLRPGDDASYRWFVVEKGGRILMVPADDSPAVVVLDLSAQVQDQYTETGLVGMTFAPGWAAEPGAGDHAMYVYYLGGEDSGPRECGVNRYGQRMCSFVSRFMVTSEDGGASFSVSSEEILMRVAQPYDTHKGGTLHFGPDGYLYIATGDGGSAFDPHCNGQSLLAPYAKILRIDVTGGAPYGIPPTNPFAGVTALCNDHQYVFATEYFQNNPDLARDEPCPETYAWGFRNPWRFSIDQVTGTVWVGDVGQDFLEEVNRVELGGNYGWNVVEGSRPIADWARCTSVEPTGSLIAPLVEYNHGTSGRAAVTGGVVYRGAELAGLVGQYLFTDSGSAEIWALSDPYGRTDTLVDPEPIAAGSGAFVAMVEDEHGEVYVIDLVGGPGQSLLRLTPAVGGGSTLPARLSATGCVDAEDPREPAPGLIPYDVNAALWSDGADKERFLAMPDGATITITESGDWELPVGSILMKTFEKHGRMLETRFMVRHDDGEWAGYTYVWGEAQDDAYLESGHVDLTLADEVWSVPSRSECLACHTRAAGRSLGLETAQLNRSFVYDGERRANQITTLAHIGMFDAPPGEADELEALPYPLGDAPLDERARAYLHANCSHCHRPQGGAIGVAMDLRFETPFAATETCDVRPSQGGDGSAEARIITPGDADLSLLYARMLATDSERMPPLGRNLVDDDGRKVVRDFIESLESCE